MSPIVSCKLVDVNPEEETIDWAYEQDQDPVVKRVKELVTSDSNLHDYTHAEVPNNFEQRQPLKHCTLDMLWLSGC